MELLEWNHRFRVHVGDDVSYWRRQANGLPQGSVLAPTLFSPITRDLPITRSHRFIYADDICCALQVEFFSKIECTLTADLAHLVIYCQLWRLKPSTSKTVTSVFHLHNNRSCHELNVYVNGQRLKHDPYPVYLGITLDWIVSYREHLPRNAAKLKSRNTWLWNSLVLYGVPAQTLHTSALALCCSVAEYASPVWTRSSYTNLIDTQLRSAVRLISGCLQPTQLSWLPVLSSLHLLLCIIKQQLTVCFKSSKPIQTGLCMLMSLRIHLYGLHLDA